MGKCLSRSDITRDEELISTIISNCHFTKINNKNYLINSYNNLLDKYDYENIIEDKTDLYMSNKSKNEKFINSLIYSNDSNENNKSEYYEVQYRYLSYIFTFFETKILKVIGVFIILNGYSAIQKDKVEMLITHILQFYGKDKENIKEFLLDNIYLNTICISKSLIEKLDAFSFYETKSYIEKQINILLDYQFEKYKLTSIDALIIDEKQVKKEKKTKKSEKSESLKKKESLNSNLKMGKIYDEDKEKILRNFIYDNFDMFKGNEIRLFLNNNS